MKKYIKYFALLLLSLLIVFLIGANNKSKSKMRVLKGGSWANGSWALKNFNRTGDFEDRKLPVYGFRCVKSNTN